MPGNNHRSAPTALQRGSLTSGQSGANGAPRPEGGAVNALLIKISRKKIAAPQQAGRWVVREEYPATSDDRDLLTRLAAARADAELEARRKGGALLDTTWRPGRTDGPANEADIAERQRRIASWLRLRDAIAQCREAVGGDDSPTPGVSWTSDTAGDDGLVSVYPHAHGWWLVQSQTMGVGSTDLGLVIEHPTGWIVQVVSAWCGEPRFYVEREETSRA